jgi:transposase
MHTLTKSNLPDNQWDKLRSFLAHHPRVYVGKENECRIFLEGVMWVKVRKTRWRELPSTYGNWNTVYKRFARWDRNNVFRDMAEYFSNDPEIEVIRWFMEFKKTVN